MNTDLRKKQQKKKKKKKKIRKRLFQVDELFSFWKSYAKCSKT